MFVSFNSVMQEKQQAKVLLLKGKIRYDQQNYINALMLLKQSIDIRPLSAAVKLTINCLEKIEQYSDALIFADKLIDMKPSRFLLLEK